MQVILTSGALYPIVSRGNTLAYKLSFDVLSMMIILSESLYLIHCAYSNAIISYY